MDLFEKVSKDAKENYKLLVSYHKLLAKVEEQYDELQILKAKIERRDILIKSLECE